MEKVVLFVGQSEHVSLPEPELLGLVEPFECSDVQGSTATLQRLRGHAEEFADTLGRLLLAGPPSDGNVATDLLRRRAERFAGVVDCMIEM